MKKPQINREQTAILCILHKQHVSSGKPFICLHWKRKGHVMSHNQPIRTVEWDFQPLKYHCGGQNQETESLGQNFYFDDTFHLNSSKTEFKCILLIHKCKCIQCNKCILSKITTQSLNQHLSEWQNKQLNRKKMIAIFYCKQNTVQIQFPNYIQDQKRQ